MKSVRINLTELWGHPSLPHLGDARVPDGAPSPDPCTPGLRKLPPHSPRPALTSGRAPAAPLEICQAAPRLGRGALPRPSSCQPPPPPRWQTSPGRQPARPAPAAAPALPSPAGLGASGGASSPRASGLRLPSGPRARPCSRRPVWECAPVCPAPSLGAFQSGFGLLGLRHLLVSASLSQIFAPSFLAAVSLGPGPALYLPVPSSLAFLRPRTPRSPARGGARCRRGGAVLRAPGARSALTSSCLRRRK